MTEPGTEHVGPIVFSDSTARGQLLNHGQVVTFRKDERTTGDTWWRKSRTGEKMGDCHVREIGHVDPSNPEHLRVFQPHSGFRSIESWQEAIERLNGDQMPEDGVLYHVEAVEGDCGKCGEVAYLPTNTFCPACHREEAARADGGQPSTGSERYNRNAARFLSLTYDELGGTMLRTHIELAREYDLSPIHVPVARDGVVA